MKPRLFIGERRAHLHQKLMMTSHKRRFILKIAKAKNARAFGVRWSALFYITAQNFVTVELQILCIRELLKRLHNPRLLLLPERKPVSYDLFGLLIETICLVIA